MVRGPWSSSTSTRPTIPATRRHRHATRDSRPFSPPPEENRASLSETRRSVGGRKGGSVVSMHDAELIVCARLADVIVVQPFRRRVPGAILTGLELRQPRLARAFDQR